jgi:hypothetical protein
MTTDKPNMFIRFGDAIGVGGKIIGAILGAISLAGIIFAAGMKAERKNNKQIEIIAIQDTIQDNQKKIMDELKLVKDTVGKVSKAVRVIVPEFKTQIDKVTQAQQNLKNYMVEKAATKQDVLQVQKIFEVEKKN